MHVLYLTYSRSDELEEEWRRAGIRSTWLPILLIGELLRETGLGIQAVADAFVLPREKDPRNEVIFEARAVSVFLDVRSLPNNIAMRDGRKWNALPFIMLAPQSDLSTTRSLLVPMEKAKARDVHVAEMAASNSFGAGAIKKYVHHYREAMLNELERLGILVTYESGRFRVGPALSTTRELEGYYYFGPADQSDTGFRTVDRDLFGIQFEVEKFEALINRSDVSERELQVFFEEHPHFLSTIAEPLSQVRLQDYKGRVLIPDFILKPLVAAQRDSRWEILDLKLPQMKLLVGKRARRRLSQQVMKAIRQLRDYGDYFSDRRNLSRINDAVGRSLRYPRLGVLIGRLPSGGIEALVEEQRRLPDVRIVTYDEILQDQERLA